MTDEVVGAVDRLTVMVSRRNDELAGLRAAVDRMEKTFAERLDALKETMGRVEAWQDEWSRQQEEHAKAIEDVLSAVDASEDADVEPVDSEPVLDAEVLRP